ncbi:hypothetical protein [Rahnella woolbedingensis]|uniref:hypothetical protein n=1 Tax=Rahnella woolbedingensis TaxID=1510574 RepID=UPI0011C49573|nr:hypothetical protein [Rahnella woolbedingensis]
MLSQKELKLLDVYFSRNLTRENLELLKRHNAAKGNLLPLGLKLTTPQTPAASNKIFILQRAHSGLYFISPVNGGVQPQPELNGRFLFVILATNPSQIYCGKAYDPINQFLSGSRNDSRRSGVNCTGADNAFNSSDRFEVEGHTSLTKCEDVLFAGDMLFRFGTLISWANNSGHYQPSPSLRQTNLYPNIKRLLPESLFQEYDFERLSIGPGSADSRRASDFSSFSSFGSNNSRSSKFSDFSDN